MNPLQHLPLVWGNLKPEGAGKHAGRLHLHLIRRSRGTSERHYQAARTAPGNQNLVTGHANLIESMILFTPSLAAAPRVHHYTASTATTCPVTSCRKGNAGEGGLIHNGLTLLDTPISKHGCRRSPRPPATILCFTWRRSHGGRRRSDARERHMRGKASRRAPYLSIGK